jgi:hypothetical protein
VLGDENESPEARIKRALSTLADDLGDDTYGALFVKLDNGVVLASYIGGAEPPEALAKWSEERVLGATHDDVTQTDFAEGTDPDVLILPGQRYRISVLSVMDAQRQVTIGALVFSEQADAPNFLPQASVQALAQWLHRNVHGSNTTSSSWSLVSRSITQ